MQPTVHIQAQGIDEAISGVFGPIVDVLEKIVFFAIPMFGTNVPIVIIWLVVGAIFCNFYFRIRPLRDLPHTIDILKGKFARKSDPGQISSFQATSTELAGTTGLGNIAGVAVAITVGGPGAALWIMIAGALGMALKFAEATLGAMYRRVNDDGTVSGGPMYVLRDGLEKEGKPGLGKFLGAFYAAGMAVAVMGAGNIFQANQVAQHLTEITGGDESFFAGRAWLIGIFLLIPAALVIIGGIQSIARWTSRLVPVMALLYAVAVSAVILVNISEIPHAIQLIVTGAFNPQGIAGGMLGVAIVGVQRALFSNVAGVGTAALAHSATKNNKPTQEGILAAWEPFLDSVVICTMTALAIVVTGEHLNEGQDGVTLTTNAFATVGNWFPIILSICVVLFAFSTVLSYAYYGEKTFGYLFKNNKVAEIGYKIVYLIMIVVGAAVSLETVTRFSDSTFFLVAIPNILGIYLLAKPLKREITGYRRALAAGEITPLPEAEQVGMMPKDPKSRLY